MSELIQKHDNRTTIRWKLLTGVSALALTIAATSAARAEDSGHPLIWIELGGQMEMMQGLSAPFTAPFMTAITPTPGPYKNNIFMDTQRPPRFAFGEEGKISFRPEDSDWVFTAGIRYGRSHRHAHVHRQTELPTYFFTFTVTPNYIFRRELRANYAPFADVNAPSSEKHTILDFTAGKDVGLGILGPNGTSTLNAGVRSADFTSDTDLDIQARPFVTPIYYSNYYFGEFPKNFTWDQYMVTGHAERSFRGVGPEISWEASAALAGNAQDGEITLDWSVNAAALFGRQKTKTDHATQQKHAYRPHEFGVTFDYPMVYHHPTDAPAYHSTRSRSVTVPNVGVSIGLSYRYSDAKISFGYRYDTFLNAMDTGIDARKTSDMTFQGPYASISFGFGD